MEHCKSAKTRRSEQMGSTMLLAAADVQTGHIFFSSIALGRHARKLLLGVREGEACFFQNEVYGLLLKVERWLWRTIVSFFSCFVL
jgi:hypothetical protein